MYVCILYRKHLSTTYIVCTWYKYSITFKGLANRQKVKAESYRLFCNEYAPVFVVHRLIRPTVYLLSSWKAMLLTEPYIYLIEWRMEIIKFSTFFLWLIQSDCHSSGKYTPEFPRDFLNGNYIPEVSRRLFELRCIRIYVRLFECNTLFYVNSILYGLF